VEELFGGGIGAVDPDDDRDWVLDLSTGGLYTLRLESMISFAYMSLRAEYQLPRGRDSVC